jgi:hypothetical protein
MKRIAPVVLAAALLLGGLPFHLAVAEDTKTVWEKDQTITDVVAIEGDRALEISAGVNVTFTVPEELPQNLEDTVPSVTVNGTLTVNGTQTRPVVFEADPDIVQIFPEPPYLCVNGTPGGARFVIQNATFHDSQVAFVNCTFLGTYIPIWGEGVSSTALSGCIYDNSVRKPPRWATNIDVGFYLHGDFSMTGCTVKCPGTMMHGHAGRFTMTDCFLEGGLAQSGIGLYYADSLNPGARSEFRNVTFDGVYLVSETDTLIEGCKFDFDYEAILLDRIFGHRTVGNETFLNITNVTLRDNTFHGNGVAIKVYGPEMDVNTDRFERGNDTLGIKILEQYNYHYVLVADQTGQWIDYPTITTANASGAMESHSYSGFKNSCLVELLEQTIDGCWTRQSQYPYTIFAEKDGLTSDTLTITPDNLSLTLVVPVLPDLVPSDLAPDRLKVAAGQPVSFSAKVENRGLRNLSYVLAVLYVDGVRFDEKNITSFAPGGNVSPAFKDWNATAGRHAIEVRLDPVNVIPEYNETNNNLTYSFVVPEPPPPDRTWTYVQLGVGAVGIIAIIAMYIRMRRRPVS